MFFFYLLVYSTYLYRLLRNILGIAQFVINFEIQTECGYFALELSLLALEYQLGIVILANLQLLCKKNLCIL